MESNERMVFLDHQIMKKIKHEAAEINISTTLYLNIILKELFARKKPKDVFFYQQLPNKK